MSDKRYVFDTNIFIDAARKYYAFDICPGFWTEVIRHSNASRVCTIDRVKEEVLKGKDRLASWISREVVESVVKLTNDVEVQRTFSAIMTWVQSSDRFKRQAKAEFADVADGWVVAFAKTNGRIVVTHEEYAPEAQKKVPIPNICSAFNVEYCSLFDALRELKVRFKSKSRASH